MKRHHNHGNPSGTIPQLVPVHFEFTHPTATSVCIAGSFNHWQPESKSLHPSGTGNWWKDTALAPGNYEDRLIVDGQWMPDPLAKETVPNPFGGRNSVLKVAGSPEGMPLNGAENLSPKNPKQQKTQKI